MSLVTTVEMLKKAQEGRYAIGAFNAENMEMVQAIVKAAEIEKSPVIIQTTPTTLKYATCKTFYNNVKAVAKNSIVPVAVHLDHGNSVDLAVDAMVAGYTSVMIDGSKTPLEDNISLTREVVALADKFGVPVEAELGKLSGKEDAVFSAESCYTDPDEAVYFVDKTKISSLAVAIGTAHGIYKGTPKLDVNLLSEIRKRVDIPLVLHGASGLTVEQVRETIERGICKVNIATELRIAFSDAVKAYLKENPETFDPKKYLGPAREAVVEAVRGKIRMCGSENKI